MSESTAQLGRRDRRRRPQRPRRRLLPRPRRAADRGLRAARDRRRLLRDRGVRARLSRLDRRLRAQHAARADLARPAPGRARDRRRPGGPVAQPLRRRLGARSSTTTWPAPRSEIRRFSAADARALPRVRGRARPDRRADHAADRHHPAGPGLAAPARARPARPARRAGRPPPGADRATRPTSSAPRRPSTCREWFESEQVLAALGWHAINDSTAGPVDPGNRLRPAPRPRLRAGRRRNPPVGLRARRDRPPARGDGRRRARGGRRGAHRCGGRAGPGQRTGARPGSGSPAARSCAPRGCSPTPIRRPPSSVWSATAELPDRFVAALRAYRCEGTSVKINLAVDELPVAAAVGRRRGAAVPSRHRRGQPDGRRDGRGPGRGPGGPPGGRPPHRALHPDRARSLAGPGRKARGDDRRQLPALHAGRGLVGRDPRLGRRPRDRQARRVLPQPAGLDPRAPGARSTRPRGAARDLGRARAARRDGLRPALQPAPGSRLGRLPDADSRPLSLRRRDPPRRRGHRRERPQLRARGAPRRAHDPRARLRSALR